MDIAFNGRPVTVQAATVAELLREMAIPAVRVAVERNRELVPRRLWEQTPVRAGDAIEVVQMVGGGAGGYGPRPETSAGCR